MDRPPGVPATWKGKAGERYIFKHAWPYRNGAGDVLGHVARFEAEQQNGINGKQIVPFFKLDKDGFKFKAGAAPEPRPLFGLDTVDRPGPLFVVEGEKVATALHRLGLAAVAAPGGARAASKADWTPAFESVTPDRPLILWPDNDPPGRAYAVDVYRLANGAAEAVRVVTALPEGTRETDGADAADWLTAAPGEPWDGLGPLPEGADIEALRERLLGAVEPVLGDLPAEWAPEKPEPREPKEPRQGVVPYVATERGILAIARRNGGEVTETLLSNFEARIVEELLLDEGQETALTLVLDGARGGRELSTARVSATEFQGMSWPMKHWGSGCMVSPGQNTRDKLRHAVQWLSHAASEVPRRTVYTHTGWRHVAGQWLYLSAGGALGAAGLVPGVDVDLGELYRYNLPEPSRTPAERMEAARASLRLLDVAPSAVSVPLAAGTYLAPLAQALQVDMTLWAEGPSRAGKSSLAGAWCAHYGAALDRLALAANWHDTANAIEGKLFTLADTLAVVDDYAPQPSQAAQSDMDRAVSRVVRATGNRSGRGRLRADLTLRPERKPRALVLATAEQWPTGESVCARLFGIELQPGAVSLDKLTLAQRDAADGLLARCMADYLRDMAGDYEARVQAARERWQHLRAGALAEGLDGRLPEQVAFLALGHELALAHWVRCGALPEDEHPDREDAAWRALLELALQHGSRVRTAQPAEAFRAGLLELLAAGQVHLADRGHGGPPTDAGRYGWNGDTPQGGRIGWVDTTKGEAYLLATPVLEAVSEALRRSGQPVTLRPQALWRQCRERGYLLPGDSDADGSRSTRVVKVLGHAERVLVFVLARLGLAPE